MSLPRVAFCTDTFDEPNGFATISRQFAAFAKKHRHPMLLVRPGDGTRYYSDGSLTIVDLAKSKLCVPLDMGLRFDLRISRHFAWMREQFTAFDPDVVHITGPGDIGVLCTRLSHVLRTPKIPLVAAWHTNLHPYARMRAMPLLRMLPTKTAASLGAKIEAGSLRAAARFYKPACLIFAPNEEILSQLPGLTGKPGCLMPHGVDTDLFVPERASIASPITLGYVGQLIPEKNVRFLAQVAARLPAKMRSAVRFLIVGNGSEGAWLERQLPGSRLTGFLNGRDLAKAYAEMDILLFPSLSDTFGLVVLEAMAAGVPAVSFRLAGPQSAVEHGVTGYTADTADEFAAHVRDLVVDADLRRQFR
jgi:phosphatidylinositol alpha 1,6-mannosyltransferase